MKNNSIITATDKKYGDFTIEYWYKSLKENVNLKNIDIAVIDYGMSETQKFYLKSNKIKVYNTLIAIHQFIGRLYDSQDKISQFKDKIVDYLDLENDNKSM
jgi:hypothetical protein